MICPIGGNVENRYGPGYMLEWCRQIESSVIPLKKGATSKTVASASSDMMTTL